MGDRDREARRRKIVDRGNDRFALITGRTPNNMSSTDFPLPSSPSYGRHERAASCPPLEQDNKPKFGRSPVLTHANRFDDERSPGVLMSGHNGFDEPEKIDSGPVRHRALPPLRKSEISSDASSAPSASASQSSAKFQSSRASANQHSSVTTAGSDQMRRPPPLPRNQVLAAINADQIISAIEATEQSRMEFSMKVAAVVAMANIGFPIIGWSFIKSTISLMPLYIVLLTNMTFVVAQFLAMEERPAVKDADKFPSGDGSNWADQLGDALQAGILMMRVGRAMFTDVAVYAAIVTCILCFKT